MKKYAAKSRNVGLLLLFMAVLLVFGGTRMVSADTTTYKVTYANAKGRSTGNYRKWSKTVNAGEQVQLPKISRKGYEAKWVTTINGKKYKYSPGQKVTINRNTKFCLNLYKIYTVRYYTANGKKEYKKLRQTVSSGKRVKLPTGSSNATYQFMGWSTKVGGNVAYKSGKYIRVKNNIKLYAVQKKVSGIVLCRNNGKIWKTVSASGTAKFPEVAMTNGDMCLGWSRTKGKSTLSA